MYCTIQCMDQSQCIGIRRHIRAVNAGAHIKYWYFKIVCPSWMQKITQRHITEKLKKGDYFARKWEINSLDFKSNRHWSVRANFATVNRTSFVCIKILWIMTLDRQKINILWQLLLKINKTAKRITFSSEQIKKIHKV